MRSVTMLVLILAVVPSGTSYAQTADGVPTLQSVATKYAAFKTDFLAVERTVGDTAPDPAATSVFVTKAFIGVMLSSAFNDADASLSVSVPPTKLMDGLKYELRTPKFEELNCSGDRWPCKDDVIKDCTRHYKVTDPVFGKIIAEGDEFDLLCAADWKIKKDACELSKKANQTGCEFEKAAFNAISNKELGSVATDDIIASGSMGTGKLLLTLDGSLGHGTIAATISGNLNANTHLSINTLSLIFVGVPLVCRLDNLQVDVPVTIGNQPIAPDLALRFSDETGTLEFFGDIAPSNVSVQVDAAPAVTRALTQNPSNWVTCALPVAAALVLNIAGASPSAIPMSFSTPQLKNIKFGSWTPPSVEGYALRQILGEATLGVVMRRR
jgi:hypothetical protein